MSEPELTFAPFVGKVLAGRYSLVKGLGAGGYGAVLLAHDAVLERDVAVKVLVPRLGSDDTMVKRFRREALVLARLRHPNLVQVLDYGETEGLLFIVMELVKGPSLTDLLREHFPLPPERVVELMDQMLLGLADAHAQGVIHRDVKPDNVIIEQRRDGTELVKLVDFGIARLTGSQLMSLTAEGFLTGTPEYMSPEQCRDQPLDGRSDLYAAGCVLYQLLCGHPPFSAANPVDVLLAHLYHDPIPPSIREVEGVAPALERCALWCLSKLPQERPADAESLRQELRRAAQAGFVVDSQARANLLGKEGDHRRLGADTSSPQAGSLQAQVLAISQEPGRLQAGVEALRALGAKVTVFAGLPSPTDVGQCEVGLLSSGDPWLEAQLLELTSRGIPVLVCGPDDDLDAMARAVGLGAYDYVPLPVNPLALRRSLVRALKLSGRARGTRTP